MKCDEKIKHLLLNVNIVNLQNSERQYFFFLKSDEIGQKKYISDFSAAPALQKRGCVNFLKIILLY